MSHKLQAQTVRARVSQGVSQGFRRSSILDTVHDVETAELRGSLRVCDNPLCDVSFPESGLACKPKRFHCEECKQQASLIRRVSALLEGLTDDEALRIIRWK